METLLTPAACSTQDQYTTEIDKICHLMGKKDFCFIPGDRLKSILQEHDTAALIDFKAFQDSWSRLALDEYMADGGKYRKRRHATLSATAGSNSFHVESHQPHFQSLTYNTLNGGCSTSLSTNRAEHSAG